MEVFGKPATFNILIAYLLLLGTVVIKGTPAEEKSLKQASNFEDQNVFAGEVQDGETQNDPNLISVESSDFNSNNENANAPGKPNQDNDGKLLEDTAEDNDDEDENEPEKRVRRWWGSSSRSSSGGGYSSRRRSTSRRSWISRRRTTTARTRRGSWISRRRTTTASTRRRSWISRRRTTTASTRRRSWISRRRTTTARSRRRSWISRRRTATVSTRRRRWISRRRTTTASTRRRSWISRRRTATASTRRRRWISRRRTTTASTRRRRWISRRRTTTASTRRRSGISRRRTTTASTRRRSWISRRRTTTASTRRRSWISRRRTTTARSRRRSWISRRRTATVSTRRRRWISRRRTTTASTRRRSWISRRRTATASTRRRRWISRRRTTTASTRRRRWISRRRTTTASTRRRSGISRRRTTTASRRRRSWFSRRRTTTASRRRRSWFSRRRTTTASRRRRSWFSRRRTTKPNFKGAAITPKAKGRAVVKYVVDKVEKALGGTKKLLMRTAVVESNYGKDRNTYRKNYYGGIFQVGKKGFKATQNVKSHPKLKKRFKTIKKAFGIDWLTVKWQDLVKPLFSAIAARLVYLNEPEAIPADLAGQGKYWKKHYNTPKGDGTSDNFVQMVDAEVAITPKAKGRAVVKYVVDKVEKALGGTNNLLMRTALVESNYGKDTNTYKENYYGGIFQVDKIGFEDTQDVKSHPNLTNHFKIIKEEFDVDWPKVQWQDLEIPLCSAIAARLVYLNEPEAIPADLEGQAKYWKKHYNTPTGDGKWETFVQKVKAEEKANKG